MRLERATVCLPTKNRRAAHGFYTALGFVAVGELDADGLPEPLQFEISAGLRVMLIPSIGFGWVIGGCKRSPRVTHECLIAIGLPTDADIDRLMRRAKAAGAKIVLDAGMQKWGYAGAFADLDGHVWQVGRVDGFLDLTRRLRSKPGSWRRQRSQCESAGADRKGAVATSHH